MNKSKIIFSILVILIIDILALVAQPTPVPGENCDKPQTCNDSLGFAYVFCKPGSMGSPDSLIAHCVKDPNNAVDSYSGKPLKPLKRTMPVCAKLARVEGDTTFDFTMAELQSKMDQASGGWNCLCDFPNNSNTCCARVIFTTNTDLSRRVAATPGLTPQVVPQPCDQFPCDTESVKIYIANDGDFRAAQKLYLGDSTDFSDPTGKKSPMSLTEIIQHEIGHYANMNHYYGGGVFGVSGAVRFDRRAQACRVSGLYPGVMNNVDPDNQKRQKLSNNDKCNFMLLYCPNKIGTSGVNTEAQNGVSTGFPHPNPARDIVNIPFSLVRQGSIKIVIYNEKGEKVYTLLDVDKFPAGEHSIYYNTTLTSNGNYFYTVESNGAKTSSKFVIKR